MKGKKNTPQKSYIKFKNNNNGKDGKQLYINITNYYIY